jgi:TolB-like protein
MTEPRETSEKLPASHRLVFDDYQFDSGTGQLWQGDKEIRLTPRAAALLTVLTEYPKQLVTKQLLIDRVWAGRAVGDDSLTSCMQELRRALGDDPRCPRLIETRHRRGYRLLVPIAHATSAEAALAEALPLALPDKPSIAVLPFQNMSGDPEQEYFVDGLVEDIITALSRFKSLFVIARNSSFTYKGKTVDIKQVGRELGVRYVLEGSIRKAANRVRITGQLVESETGNHLWADRFDGALEDVFTLQDVVTEKVIAQLAPSVEQAEIERARRKPTANLGAYDCYLRGLALFQTLSREKFDEAIGLFRRTLELDPEHSSALGTLLACLANRKSWGISDGAASERDEVARLVPLAARIGRDDAVALAYAAYAIALVLGDLAFAQEQVDRALMLNPNLALAWGHSGWIRVWSGDPATAIEHLSRSIRHDPLNVSGGRRSGLAHAHFFLDRHEEALQWAVGFARRNPDAHPALRIGAASAAFAGKANQAQRFAAGLVQIDPAFRVSRLEDYLGPYRSREFLEKYKQGLRLAGLPE